MPVSVSTSSAEAVELGLCVDVYNSADELDRVSGPKVRIEPGAAQDLSWVVPSTEGYPIADVGIEVSTAAANSEVHLDRLDWTGTPTIELGRREGSMWRRSWVNAVDSNFGWRESFRLIQNSGTPVSCYTEIGTGTTIEYQQTLHLTWSPEQAWRRESRGLAATMRWC